MIEQKWLQLAVSKDKSRYNLCDIYRDKTRLVATDGHRLHVINGLPESTPCYVGGTDAVFPDYQIVIDQCKGKPIATLNFESLAYNRTLKAAWDILKKIQPIAKLYDNAHQTCSLVYTAGSDKIVIRLRHKSLFLDFDFPCAPENDAAASSFEIKVNLKYLIDALSLVSERVMYLSIYGDNMPIKIYSPDSMGPGVEAYVMPLRK